VLASDAAHYLENFLNRSPFPIVSDVGDMLRGYDLIQSLAESDQHVIAGHDPQTMNLYNQVGKKNLEIVSLTEPSKG